MTKTPRTDAESGKITIVCEDEYCAAWTEKDGDSVDVVDVSHARELETELVELQEAVRSFRDVVGRHHTQQAAERLILMLPEANKP